MVYDDYKKIQELKDEGKRLESLLDYVRDQIRNFEYREPKNYTLPHDYKQLRVRFGGDDNAR